MTRTAYDFTHDNVAYMRQHFPGAQMIFWYGTGSIGIDWTAADRALWPGATMLEIDQGGAGSPVLTAHIRDVENGAWGPGRAVDKTGWHVARPTLYGSRSAIEACVNDGWRGDVWLAAPGTVPSSAPTIPGVNVVAVQNNWQANYDSSIVFDDTWYPIAPPAPVPTSVKVTVTQRRATIEFTTVPNTSHYVVHYQESPLIAPLVLFRAGQPVSTHNVVVVDVAVPDARSGVIYVDAIVNAKAVRVGSVDLP